MFPLPDNRSIAIIGTAAALALVAVYIVVRAGPKGGQDTGRAVAGFVGGTAVGVIKGIGDAVGLPDPADPVTVTEGRIALANGEYFEASKKLPAGEFLAAVFARLSPAYIAGQALGLGGGSTYVGDLPLASDADGQDYGMDRLQPSPFQFGA